MIFERYKDKVNYWLTFNEINAGAMPFGASHSEILTVAVLLY